MITDIRHALTPESIPLFRLRPWSRVHEVLHPLVPEPVTVSLSTFLTLLITRLRQEPYTVCALIHDMSCREM